ncbi:Fc receptor-like protein 5 isoform X2 [Anarhichas minor]|uniref:Fc receptor-like protein 5 isoform X2 n=1 Tax=Anarhichas minor TaxID=65739 RepID=UPI003F736169
MEVTALCVRLMTPVMLLLVAQVDFSYSQKAAFPQVVPNRQQHFQYESLVVSCEGLEGLTGWRVMQRIKGVVKTCATAWSNATEPCEIKDAYPALDSGEYWCVMGVKTSNTVNITVTDGPVILESPVHPVMEGEATALSCRVKQASPNLTAEFFKDGHLMERSSTENVNILTVSKSNEGLYKCRIPGVGESPVSWLTVRVMNVLLLPVARVHLNNSPENALIVPTKLQLFEYSSISINCEGFITTTGWTVMRKMKGKVDECVSTWVTTPASVCAIKPVYLTDSGEYWCETGEERSNVVNITVTAGNVILESPALPVKEGDTVTLRCRTKTTSSALIADFYKDDFLIGTDSTGEMTMLSVSKSNEGLYKCSISEFGESPQSWLAVRVHRETPPSSDHSCHVYLVLRTVFTIVMVALLLLLLVGLLHFGKVRVTQK